MGTIFRSKNEVVYDLLHQAIIRGDYKPDERIVIDELASRLNVSQIPIREALRQLEADGFVTNEPYVGVTVTGISADFIFEIFALLETMEVVTGRAACARMSDEEIETLADLVQGMDASIDNPDRWSEQNKQFHLLICEYAYTGLIKGMMRKVLDHWDRLRLHYLKDVLGQRLVRAQAEHHEIITAFRKRDPDAVEKILRSHNQNALASYIGYLQSAGYLMAAPGDGL